MAHLKDLKVTKVAFVRSGANKREYFLAKSADGTNGGASLGATNIINVKDGGAKPMRPEVRLRLGDILKEERDINKVCALLKEDGVLKATDAEIAEVRDFVSLIPPPPGPDPQVELELQKAKDAAKAAEEAKTQAEAQITEMKNAEHKAEVTHWVEKECKHLNMAVDDAVAQIIKAEAVDVVTAETLKKSFKSTSDALKASKILEEVGRSGDGGSFDSIGGNLVGDVANMANELHKSSNGRKKSDCILAAIQAAGSQRFETYRKDFNRRAKAQ